MILSGMRILFVLCSFTFVSLAFAEMTHDEAALACNAQAYEMLKQQGAHKGTRKLRAKAAAGKKYAGRAILHLNMINKCTAEPYLSDCKPMSKVTEHKDKLHSNEGKLEENIKANPVCATSLISKISTMNPDSAEIRAVVQEKVKQVSGA